MRRGRRLVRRGEVAEDVPVARYAVAFARERQRQNARSLSFPVRTAMGVVVVLVMAGLAADAFTSAEDVSGASLGAFAVLIAYALWRNSQERSNVEEAEQINRDFLRRAGAPYVPGGPPTSVYVSALAAACSFVVQLAVFIPFAGVISLLLNEESVSPGRAVSGVATHWLDFLILAFGVVCARSRNQRLTGRSTPEYQYLHDLD